MCEKLVIRQELASFLSLDEHHRHKDVLVMQIVPASVKVLVKGTYCMVGAALETKMKFTPCEVLGAHLSC